MMTDSERISKNYEMAAKHREEFLRNRPPVLKLVKDEFFGVSFKDKDLSEFIDYATSFRDRICAETPGAIIKFSNVGQGWVSVYVPEAPKADSFATLEGIEASYKQESPKEEYNSDLSGFSVSIEKADGLDDAVYELKVTLTRSEGVELDSPIVFYVFFDSDGNASTNSKDPQIDKLMPFLKETISYDLARTLTLSSNEAQEE